MPSYRVVQWATGNIGTRSLRHVIEHPDLELVGVWVHTPEKIGRDAGELIGEEPIGIAATHDADALIPSDGGRAVPGSGRAATLSLTYRL